MKAIIGIDPGLDGAIVIVEELENYTFAMPTVNLKGGKRAYDINKIRQVINCRGTCAHVFLEKQQAMPATLRGRAQGGASTFSTGYGFGLLVGLLAGMEIPYTLVHPRTWQAALFRDMPKSDTKATALIVAGRLYPGLDLRATERSRKAHAGIVDALLIATYGQRILNGGY